MGETLTAAKIVILTDQDNNQYAFSPEQLADARVDGAAFTDMPVVAREHTVDVGVNKKPGGQW